jgi:hypothetical protein
MKFLEVIRGTELEFEVEDTKNGVQVLINIPGYGHWVRGAYYKVSELNEIVLKKLNHKSLVSKDSEGIIHADKTKQKRITLSFDFTQKYSASKKSSRTNKIIKDTTKQ